MGVAVQDGSAEQVSDFSGYDVRPEVVRRVPRALAIRYDVLCVASDGNQLTVAIPERTSDDVLDRLKLATGMRITAVVAPLEAIRERLRTIYPGGGAVSFPAARGGTADAPAIGTLDRIHERAIVARASDLHIEPSYGGGRIRQRIDGILHEVCELSPELFTQLVSRVKILAGMDIADKRQPQDGRYNIESSGRAIDARVSSMPTISGEKLVIRLLDHHAQIPSLEHLGMPLESLPRYRRIARAPHGFVVVCGPTGSGKTTTLYATLSERDLISENLCSVEDPVEVRMAGVSQVQVNQRAGVTFSSALRSFLRQDPNVIMVGEMRDSETASVAVSAALSGQLVITTLHSSDAVRAIDRLLELGIDRHFIASGLTAIVAQRLIRKLCPDCRAAQICSASQSHEFGIEAGALLYARRGCSRCSETGYRGRTAIFEFLFLSDSTREAISAGESAVAVGNLARGAGYVPMLRAGVQSVLTGSTSLEELQRVLAFEQSQ